MISLGFYEAFSGYCGNICSAVKKQPSIAVGIDNYFICFCLFQIFNGAQILCAVFGSAAKFRVRIIQLKPLASTRFNVAAFRKIYWKLNLSVRWHSIISSLAGCCDKSKQSKSFRSHNLSITLDLSVSCLMSEKQQREREREKRAPSTLETAFIRANIVEIRKRRKSLLLTAC